MSELYLKNFDLMKDNKELFSRLEEFQENGES